MRCLLLLLSCACIYFASCRCKVTKPCTGGYLSVGGVGYDTTDIDSGWVLRYKPDNAFDTLIDSFRTSLYTQVYSNDTVFLDFTCNSGSDYKIRFPTTGQVFTISHIEMVGNTSQEFYYNCEKGSDGLACFNNNLSCSVNGQTIQYTNGHNPGYFFHK